MPIEVGFVKFSKLSTLLYADAQAVGDIRPTGDPLQGIHMEVVDAGRAIGEDELFVVRFGFAPLAHGRIALAKGLKVFAAIKLKV